MKFLLLIFLFLALLLRFYTLPQNLFFASEQGRDLLVLNDIVQNHKFTLIGPRTSVEGIFHGPLYYYFSLIPFMLGQGNPLAIIVFYIFWQTAGLIFFFLLVKEFLGKEVSIWASLLYTSSYGLIVYSRWLSHPGLIIPLAILLFWLLLKISQGKKKQVCSWRNSFYPLAVIVWSAIFHFDLVVAIFLIPIIIIFFVWTRVKKPSFKIITTSVLTLILSFSSYILFDLRHNFLMINSARNFLMTSKNFIPDLGKTLAHFVFRYGQEIKDTLGPNFDFLVWLFLIPLLLLLLKKKKNPLEKLLFLWLLSVPTLGIFFNPLFGLKHYLVGLGPIIILLVVWWQSQLKQNYQKWLAKIVLLFLFINNLSLIKSWLPKNYDVFYLNGHKDMILESELKVIDYIYQDAGSKNFGWEAFTIPYWSESGWRYLFSWYGKQKYGFLPKELKKGDVFYVIIEPGGDKLFLNNWLKDSMDKRGKTIEEKNFGGIMVQKRDTLL